MRLMELVGNHRPEGISRSRVAEKMGTSPQNVLQLERRPVERVRVGTLVRYRAAIEACLADDRAVALEGAARLRALAHDLELSAV